MPQTSCDLHAARLLVPGLAVAGAAVVISMLVHGVAGVVSPLVVAVLLGVLMANLIVVPDRVLIGVRFSGKYLLRVGVALLGFRLSLDNIAALGLPGSVALIGSVSATFFGTRWLGLRLGLSRDLSLLVATGYSICGASAIAAVDGSVAADEDEVAVAVGLVTVFGTAAIFVLPVVAGFLGFENEAYGALVGASVHDVGQVVAAASAGGASALSVAIVVKLTRVLLLAPLVTGVSIAVRRAADYAPHGTKKPPIIPLFVVGFMAAVVARSTGRIQTAALDVIDVVQGVLLAAAMFGLGCGVRVARLRAVGGRPFLLGFVAWVLVTGLASAVTTWFLV